MTEPSDYRRIIEAPTLERHANAISKLRTENSALIRALNPRTWTKEMNDAWHQNLPNMHAAFDALLSAALGSVEDTKESNRP